MKYSILFFLYWLFVVEGGGDFGFSSKFNCAARFGSDDLGNGPGLGFSLKPLVLYH